MTSAITVFVHVTVEVVETKRVAGKVVDKGGDRSLGVRSIAVLRPLRFDVGIGPAVAFDYLRSYGLSDMNTIIETSKSADIDGTVTLSAYWWPRYLDNHVFKKEALLPRPMVGLSLKDPTTSLYLGGQIDPIQFLDVSFGAKLYERSDLVGDVGAMAQLDKDGKPIPPVTHSELHAAFFVSLTASTGLFQSWISALTK